MKRRWGFLSAICEVAIAGPRRFEVHCNRCNRLIATFSQHESAMNWAQAHARSKVHIGWQGEISG